MPLNKQQLLVLNNTNFPNNNIQYISPALLREFNSEMVAALQLTQSMSEYPVLVGNNYFIGNNVMQGDLRVTGTISASVIHTIYETASVIYSTGSNQLGDQLTDVQTLSGSVLVQGGLFVNGVAVPTSAITASSLITASVINGNEIQFTKGDASVFSILIDTGSAVDIAQLNAFTASQQIINSNVSQSIAGLNSKTGSYATTGSNTFTGNQIISKENVLYTNGIYWNDSTPGYNNIEIINSATGNIDLSALSGKVRVVNTSLVLTGSALTSSNDISTSANIYAANLTGSVIDSGSLVTTASFNAYTQSTDNRLNNLESTTASINTSITNINSFTQSANQRLTAIESVSGSWITESESGSFLITASFDNGTRNLTFTKGDASTFAVNIPDVSGSTGDFITTASFNAYTQSTDNRLTNIESTTASLNISVANINNFTSSANGRLNSLEAATSSYITESESGSFLITASFASQTLTFTKGDGTTFGVVIPDISGSTINTGSFATTGSNTFFGSETFNVSPSDEFRVNWGSASSASLYTENSGGPNQTLNLTSASLYINRGGLFFSSGSFTVQTGDMQFNAYPSASFTIRTQYGGDAILRSNSDYTNFNLPYAYFRATPNGGAEIIGFGNNVVISGSGTTIQGVDFIPFSASLDTRINSITGSTINTGSLLVTASYSAGTITFTKGDGSTFPLSSFASLGANQFTGNQEILNNSQLIFGNGFSLRGNATDIAQISAATTIQFITEPPAGPGGANDIKFINRVSGSQIIFQNDQAGAGNNITFAGGDILFNVVAVSGSSQKVRFGNNPSNSPISIDASNSTFTASLQQGYAWVGNSAGVSVAVATSSFAGGSVPAGTISGSAQITALGFVSSSITGSSLITASVNLNTITFTKGDNTTFALTVNTGSGGGGGQTFANPSLESISSSLVITANTFNSGAANLLHLSASNQANLVFKPNNNAGSTQISGSANIFTNPAAPTAGYVRYIGGSGNSYLNTNAAPQITSSAASISGNRPTINANIHLGATSWTINQANNPGQHTYNNNFLQAGLLTFNTLGNTGAISFQNNFGIGPTVTLNAPSASAANVAAGISGSNALTINSNIINGTIVYNGPISSSTHTFQNNTIVGTNTFNLQSGSRTYSITATSMQALTLNDNVVNAPTLGSNNNIASNLFLANSTITNRASASMTISGNSLQGFNVTNDYDSTTNGTIGRSFNLQANLISGFIGNNIYFSGSAAGTGTTNDRGRGLYGNLLIGSRISASVIGDGNRHLIASAIVGHGLNIYGTSPYDVSNAVNAGGANGGSAFFGRWNAEDGNKALSSQTVFVVGTGTSGSAGIVRKTGFLIDSGSNTFVEGTLNVSGSSTLSGSLYIQSGSTLPVSTGSAILTWDATTGQVKQASFNTIVSASVSSAEFWSTTTQSGSAGVSGSIQFNNSGSFYNVSLVNGTRLTVANAGVYNIQFSAQIETSAGADTVYIWFKKNGNNIGDSASKAVLANNTAQIMTVNILDEAVANDYYEIAYQTLNGNATVLAEAASGNIPAIPSVIATIIQVR